MLAGHSPKHNLFSIFVLGAALGGNAAPFDVCCAHEEHGQEEACTSAESVRVFSLLFDFAGCLARLFGTAWWQGQGQGQRQGENGQEAKQEEEVKIKTKNFSA